MIRFHTFPFSGNCHKVRLFLGLLGLEFEERRVDLAHGEQRTDVFLALNPLGQVPVIEDGEFVSGDSQAILAWLARKYGAAHWFPQEPAALAHVVRWLAATACDVQRGPAAVRWSVAFTDEAPTTDAIARTERLLNGLERALEGREWLAGGAAPTIGDVAVYPYLAMAGQGIVDYASWPRVQQWMRRIEALPGFVPVPELPPAAAARVAAYGETTRLA
jgi:glutathione S-transferase